MPGRRSLKLLVAAALASGGLIGAAPGQAATPASGTVDTGSHSTTQWDFAPVVGGGLGGTPIETVCAYPQCDKFDLTIKLPTSDESFYRTHSAALKIHYSWTSPSPTDLDVFAFDPQGNEISGPGKPDTSGSGDNFEDLTIYYPESGTWSIRGDAGVAPAPTAAHATATLVVGAAPPKQPALTLTSGSPRFDNFDFPVDYETRDAAQRPNAGEPSIGADWKTGAAMYGAGTQYTKLTFDDTKRPAKVTYTDVTAPEMKVVSEDTILFVDRQTQRTWALNFDLAGSQTTISDDDGASWTRTFSICSNAMCMPDHETLGAGPYHSPAPAHTYPHAVYYCAQQIVLDAACGLSTDGGVTYGPGQNLWNGACTPIHGHVRVGPTGVAYVPNESCADSKGKTRQGMSVTTDNGSTWTVRTVPDSGPGSSDPSVMEGPDGAVYFGYQSPDGHPMVAVSHDFGKTWSPSKDAGRFSGASTEDGMPFGVQNTEFSEIVTGDPGRAAFAYLGTGKPGGYEAASFTGAWYLFVSFTYDGGKTWHTVNATPNDPVQRGCVWNGGGSNPCRNMLDFNDITIDKMGRVLVAYTDGCTKSADYNCIKNKAVNGTCSTPGEIRPYTSTADCTYGKVAAFVRQWCGKGLIAKYDATLQARCTASPRAAGGSGSSGGGTRSNSGGGGGGGLANTGGTLAVPAAGLALLAGAAALGRRRRRSSRSSATGT